MPSFLKSTKSGKDFPQTKREVVFVGRSNVGKSSLLNTLYKKDLAYTGKTPGKTRLINFFDIDGRYTAVDVPGYGYARRSKQEAVEFANMMDDYFSRQDKIALCVMIVDSRIGLTDDDEDMKSFLEEKKIPYVVAANKIDKLSNNQLFKNKRMFFNEIDNIVYLSAEKRTNIEELTKVIDDALR